MESAIAEFNQLFNLMDQKKYWFSDMDQVVKNFSDGGAAMNILLPYETYIEAIKYLVAAFSEVDMRVKRHYVPVFKEVFIHLHPNNWKRAFDHFAELEEFKDEKFKRPFREIHEDLQREIESRMQIQIGNNYANGY